MKKSIFVFLTAVQLAHAQPCELETLKKIRKFEPDLIRNGEVVLTLLDSAILGKMKCENDLIKINSMFLTLCGATSPRFIHQLSIFGKNQVWKLTVAEDKVECAGDAIWLKKITTKHSEITQVVSDANQLIAQVNSCGNEVPSDYRYVTFLNGEDSGEKEVGNLVHINDDRVCDGPTQPAILKFSSEDLSR